METLTKEQAREFLVGMIAMFMGFCLFFGIMWTLGILSVRHSILPPCILTLPSLLTLGLVTLWIMEWPIIRARIINDIQNPQPLSEQDYYTD